MQEYQEEIVQGHVEGLIMVNLVVRNGGELEHTQVLW